MTKPIYLNTDLGETVIVMDNNEDGVFQPKTDEIVDHENKALASSDPRVQKILKQMGVASLSKLTSLDRAAEYLAQMKKARDFSLDGSEHISPLKGTPLGRSITGGGNIRADIEEVSAILSMAKSAAYYAGIKYDTKLDQEIRKNAYNRLMAGVNHFLRSEVGMGLTLVGLQDCLVGLKAAEKLLKGSDLKSEKKAIEAGEKEIKQRLLLTIKTRLNETLDLLKQPDGNGLSVTTCLDESFRLIDQASRICDDLGADGKKDMLDIEFLFSDLFYTSAWVLNDRFFAVQQVGDDASFREVELAFGYIMDINDSLDQMHRLYPGLEEEFSWNAGVTSEDVSPYLDYFMNHPAIDADFVRQVSKAMGWVYL